MTSVASGSVRMRLKSSRVSAFSSTRIGSRPCSSGSRSDGFATWNAPDAMNRMWSVFTAPCLVETVVPSISGSRSRCTPSRDTSPPMRPSRARDLVDLVEEHDAVVLDGSDRFLHQLILIEQLVGFLADQRLVGLLHGEPARLGASAAQLAEDVADRDRAHLRARHAGNLEHRQSAAGLLHLDLDFLVVESRRCAVSCGTTPRWRSSRPARPARRARALRRRAAPSPRTSLRFLSRVSAIAISTRSRTICSTSRPT